MPTRYTKHLQSKPVPQSQPMREDQKPNSAGGFVWIVDPFTQLKRFLILGSENGTYYMNEHDLTLQNTAAVQECLKTNGKLTVETIVDVSSAGRAFRNSPAIFALAMACSPKYANAETNRLALDAIPVVCRTATHLFEFVETVQNFRGWGRALRTAVGRWYTAKSPTDLAYQLVKYRQRNGWTHKDVLRLSHIKTADSRIAALLRWAVKGDYVITGEVENGKVNVEGMRVIESFTTAQNTQDVKTWVKLIQQEKLPREALPTEALASKDVWQALLPGMPMTALLRNLSTLTRVGVFSPLGDFSALARLTDEDTLKRARLHPLSIFMALKTYAQGRGERGNTTWTPQRQVVDALDEAFYKAFRYVEPSGKKIVLGVDVSASMSGSRVAGAVNIDAREGAAALALALLQTEKDAVLTAFDTEFYPLSLSIRQRLDDVVNVLARTGGGGTNCAIPITWAIQNKVHADVFVILTDSETWQGSIHPQEALNQYRAKVNPHARLIVVALCANRFSIGAPDDAMILNVAGFDANLPQIIREFAAGNL